MIGAIQLLVFLNECLMMMWRMSIHHLSLCNSFVPVRPEVVLVTQIVFHNPEIMTMMMLMMYLF